MVAKPDVAISRCREVTRSPKADESLRTRHGSCETRPGLKRLTIEDGCGKGFPRDAIRAQLDLFGCDCDLLSAVVLPMAASGKIPRRLGREAAGKSALADRR